MIGTLLDLGYTVRDPERTDIFAEEERDLERSRRIAMATGALVAAATFLMAASWRWGARPALTLGQALLALAASLGPAAFVYRNAWQSLCRGILNQDLLAAAAALAGLAGGSAGLAWGAFPAGAFFAATT